MIGQTISHYKILEKLGGGGMGVVYKAEDTKLKRLVALKFLPLDLTRDDEAKERFIHEAQAASALDHPNICNIHEIDETEDGQIFICMAYYEGETLKKKVGSGQLSVDGALGIAIQTAQGLARAHETGITHRDIKPANIMITNRGEVKIVDFGLAKLAGQSRLTKTGMTVGTAAYMSPEQARGEEVDGRTDIWSFGVVMYEMLTGRLPFRGEYEAAITYSILNEEPEPITGLRTGVPMELERIVNKTMAKKPGERYQHIDEMLVDVKSLSKKIDLSSLRPSTPPLRLPRRKQLYLYGGLAALVVLFIVGVLYFFIPPWRDKSIDSLAILPFNITNPDPDTDYLCDGITESLINSLSPLPNLTVMSRNAVFRYRGQQIDAQAVGRELKVKAVLTGRTVLRGENLSISVELVEVRNNSHLWGEHYNRKFAAILEVQDEIANQISEKLRLRLTSADRQRLTKRYTENTEAYQLFLKGRYYVSKFTNEGLQKGLEYFNRAIAIDPLYALAYDGLASYYIAMNDWFLSPREAMPKAKAAAQKALEIDETLAEAHSSLGVIKVWYDWDWLGAQREFKRAIELNPNYATAHDWYSLSLALIGLHEDARAVKKRALELDPLSINVNATSGATFYDARRYDLAIEQLRKTVDMDPNFWFAHFYLGRAYVQQGEFAEALAEFQKARQLEDTIAEILGGYGYALAVSGRRDEAQKMIDELMQRSKQSYISPYNIAIIYVGLGAKDQAFEWLEKAYEERSYLLSWLKVNPELDGLRSDPRFTALMKKLGLEK